MLKTSMDKMRLCGKRTQHPLLSVQEYEFYLILKTCFCKISAKFKVK